MAEAVFTLPYRPPGLMGEIFEWRGQPVAETVFGPGNWVRLSDGRSVYPRDIPDEGVDPKEALLAHCTVISEMHKAAAFLLSELDDAYGDIPHERSVSRRSPLGQSLSGMASGLLLGMSWLSDMVISYRKRQLDCIDADQDPRVCQTALDLFVDSMNSMTQLHRQLSLLG